MSSKAPPRLRMLDLFCGLGGASAAMRERGWSVLGVDVEPRLEPDVCADLRSWRYDGPKVDLLWASPECTAFSRWAKRGWYPDEPAPSLDLVEAALRLVEEVRPRYWLLENVQGARAWLAPLLGAPCLSAGSVYLWGCPPPGLLLPQPKPHKDSPRASLRSTDPRLAGWTWNRRRAAVRSLIPYEISYAVATACERAAQFPLYLSALSDQRRGVCYVD